MAGPSLHSSSASIPTSVSTSRPSAAAAPPAPLAEQVKASYSRCCLKPTFFDDFYREFTSVSATIREKFAKTDFNKQKQLLRQSITFMIMYYTGVPTAEAIVANLGKSHSRNHLNIAPELYQFWLTSLMRTVAKHDGQFNAELDQAWRTVLEKGIRAMKGAY